MVIISRGYTCDVWDDTSSPAAPAVLSSKVGVCGLAIICGSRWFGAYGTLCVELTPNP